MTEEAIHFTAQQRADIRRQRETPGLPSAPSGSKLAADLAGPIARFAQLTAVGRTARGRVNELERDKRVAERGSIKQLAAAMRDGSDGPIGRSSIQAIEAEMAEMATRVDASQLAAELAQQDIERVVRASAGAYLDDLNQLEESRRLGVLQAIDTLEAVWWSLSEIRTARAWVLNGGKPTTEGVIQPVVPNRGAHLTSVLEALRSVFDKPRQAPQPTTYPDGTPRTGWSAYGKLVTGEERIGTLGSGRQRAD